MIDKAKMRDEFAELHGVTMEHVDKARGALIDGQYQDDRGETFNRNADAATAYALLAIEGRLAMMILLFRAMLEEMTNETD